MQELDDVPDPIEAVPDPDTVRVLLADASRRRELLKSLLRVAQRKANYPPPKHRLIQRDALGETGVALG